MNLELYYPVKNPINPTNPFGTPSPMYTALGQKGHPGQDYEAPSGTPLYAPCDGDAFYAFDKNGGDGIYIRYPSNTAPIYNIILWHMYPKGNVEFPFKIATDGSITSIKAGQLLGYTDNSGYPTESDGSHLHIGVMPCNQYGQALDPANGYLGCVDPASFWNGLFAEDIGKPPIPVPAPPTLPPNPTLIEESNWLTQLSAWLKKILASIQK